MPIDAVSLGKIAVTFVCADNRQQLIDMLPGLIDSLPAGDESLGRIVLILPEAIRKLLKWPADRTPSPALFEDALVFRRAEGAIHVQKTPFS